MDVIEFLKERWNIGSISESLVYHSVNTNPNLDVVKYLHKESKCSFSEIAQYQFRQAPEKIMRYVLDNMKHDERMKMESGNELLDIGYGLKESSSTWTTSMYQYVPTYLQKQIILLMLIMREKYRPIYKDMRRRILMEILLSYKHNCLNRLNASKKTQ